MMENIMKIDIKDLQKNHEYYTIDGNKVVFLYVSPIDENEKIIKKIYVDNDYDDDYMYSSAVSSFGEFEREYICSNAVSYFGDLFSEPPKEMLHEDIAALTSEKEKIKSELEDLKKALFENKMEVNSQEKEFEKDKALAALMDLRKGLTTHWLITNNIDYYASGRVFSMVKIVDNDGFRKEHRNIMGEDHDKLKEFSFKISIDESNKTSDINFRLHGYGGDWSSNYLAIPFRSKEDAVKYMNDVVAETNDHYKFRNVLDELRNLGIKYPKEWDIKTIEAKIESIKNSLSYDGYGSLKYYKDLYEKELEVYNKNEFILRKLEKDLQIAKSSA